VPEEDPKVEKLCYNSFIWSRFFQCVDFTLLFYINELIQPMIYLIKCPFNSFNVINYMLVVCSVANYFSHKSSLTVV